MEKFLMFCCAAVIFLVGIFTYFQWQETAQINKERRAALYKLHKTDYAKQIYGETK